MTAEQAPIQDSYTEEMPADVRRLWGLDPAVTFLNHGSFGACPKPVLRRQAALRRQMERQPVDFLYRRYEERLDAARAAAAAFVGADPADFAFVPNTTAGVNAVLRSLRFRPGDELLTTDHEYNACRNVLDLVAERDGAAGGGGAGALPGRRAARPCSRRSSSESRRGRGWRWWTTSPARPAWSSRWSDWPGSWPRAASTLLVDGAHAPGMVPLDVDALGAAYYTGNFHKWVCAPKGAAFLWVRRDRQAAVRPAVTSHGANSPRTDRSRFQLEFDWTGTFDPTAWLCVPAAIEFMGSLLPGGWPALMAPQPRGWPRRGAGCCATPWASRRPCPEELLGSMAALPLPDGNPGDLKPPVFHGPAAGRALVPAPDRAAGHALAGAAPAACSAISAQAYNTLDDYARLAAALKEILG